MNNEHADDLWWSLIIKFIFPLKASLVSAFSEFVSIYTFRHVLGLESFAETYNEAGKASSKFVPKFVQHVFTENVR